MLQAHYLPHVLAARERMHSDPRLRALLDGGLDERELLAFLLQFSALGFRMVEGVERWIRRAGRACARLGRRELGERICADAEGEAGHEQLMLDDFEALTALWRHRYPEARVPLEELRTQPSPAAIERYAELHEWTIASPRPWAQLAIEFEIETMSTVVGPPLVRRCHAALGEDVTRGLSFVRTHVELDVDHSRDGAETIEALLRAEPELGPPMARVGAEALHSYLDFLGECVELGRGLARRGARARSSATLAA